MQKYKASHSVFCKDQEKMENWKKLCQNWSGGVTWLFLSWRRYMVISIM